MIQGIDLPTMLRRIRRNLSILVGATGIAMALGFVTVGLNARALGSEGLGIIALFRAGSAILAGLFQIGSHQPLIKIGQQAITADRNDRLGAVAVLALMTDTLMACLAGLCGVAIIASVPETIGLTDSTVAYAYIFTATVFASGIQASLGVMRLFNRFHYIGAFQIALSASTLLAAFTLFILERPVFDYLLCYAAIQVVVNLCQIMFAVRILHQNNVVLLAGLRHIRSAGIVAEFFSYTWTTTVTSTLDTLRRESDVVLLGYWLGPTAVGVFSVVKQLSGVFTKFANALYTAVFPEIALLNARGDKLGAQKLIRRFLVYGLLVGSVVVLGVALVGEATLYYGFGPVFATGYVALVLMLIAICVRLGAGIISMFVQVFISPERLANIYLVAFVIYVASLPVAIHFFGLAGASLGHLAFGAVLGICCWLSLKGILRSGRQGA